MDRYSTLSSEQRFSLIVNRNIPDTAEYVSYRAPNKTGSDFTAFAKCLSGHISASNKPLGHSVICMKIANLTTVSLVKTQLQSTMFRDLNLLTIPLIPSSLANRTQIGFVRVVNQSCSGYWCVLKHVGVSECRTTVRAPTLMEKDERLIATFVAR